MVEIQNIPRVKIRSSSTVEIQNSLIVEIQNSSTVEVQNSSTAEIQNSCKFSCILRSGNFLKFGYETYVSSYFSPFQLIQPISFHAETSQLF